MSVDNIERIQNHPTWRMLEKAKATMKDVLNATAPWDPVYQVVEQAHLLLVDMQYKLEAKLYRGS